MWVQEDDGIELYRVDNGSATQLGSTATKAISGTQNLELESNGSDAHTVKVDSTTEVGPETDATYTHLRGGVRARDNGTTPQTADNWRLADIAAGATPAEIMAALQQQQVNPQQTIQAIPI